MRVWVLAAILALAAGCEQRAAAPEPPVADLGACEKADTPAARDAACTALISAPGDLDAKQLALAYALRGDAKRALGDVTHALRDYRAALQLDSTNNAAVVNQAAILLDSGQLDAAAPLLERAEAQKDSAEVQTLFGRLNLTRMDHARAIEHFNAALALDSTYASALSGRGRAKERLDDVEGALADFNAAIGLQPDLAEARAGRCWIRLRADERLDEARADAAAAARADPRLVSGQICRGILHLRDRAWEEARAAFEAALAVEAGNPDAIYGRGFARKRAGDRAGDDDIDRAIAFDRRVVQRYRALDVRP